MGRAGGHYEDRLMDGQTRLHRFRYYCARGFVEKGDVVLDFGCGFGYGTKILSDRAREVIGIDLESGNIVACKMHFEGGNREFIEGDIEKIILPECDVAVGMEVVEHLYDPAGFFKRLKRKTRRLIIVSIPMGKTTDTDKTHHFDFMAPEDISKMVVDGRWELYFFTRLHVSCLAVYFRRSRHGLPRGH